MFTLQNSQFCVEKVFAVSSPLGPSTLNAEHFFSCYLRAIEICVQIEESCEGWRVR